MTSTYLILLLKIPQLFSHDLKLSILSNHAKHLKGLVPYYVLPPFTYSKRLNKRILHEVWFKYNKSKSYKIKIHRV